MSSRFLRLFAAAVSAAGGCFLIPGLSAQMQGPPPAVVTDRVYQVTEEVPRRYVGAVESIEHVNIMPRITGNLLKIHFREGEIVEKGALLYELEDTAYRAAVDGLKAQREACQAALLYSEKEFKRNTDLLSSSAVSVSSHDKATLEINSARANLKQLDALLTDAENTLSYTKIYAPISGRIGKSMFTVGNLITPSGGKLTDIAMIAPIYVRFSISEKIFRRDFGGLEGIREKAVVRIRLADDTLYGETASIALIDNKINISTNTVTLWAVFENRDHQLIPGSFVSVMLSAGNRKQRCAVSPAALVLDNEGYMVYVLDSGNKVSGRRIKTGGIADGKQIVLEGLDGSERVITEGSNKVRPGMIVRPVPADRMK